MSYVAAGAALGCGHGEVEPLQLLHQHLGRRLVALAEQIGAEERHEELTRKIGELEQQNKADKAAYEKELATIRLTAAVDAELTAAGAKNNTAVRALLADYLKDAKIEDGKVVAKVNNESITLAAKIEAMKKDANTDFLFGSTGAKLTGWKPGDPDTGRKPGEGKKPSEMSYSELAAFLAENPDAKLE